MFGLLNVVFRPASGMVGDIIDRHTSSVWAKKLWVTFLGGIMGVFELAIGVTDSRYTATMFGLVAGLACSMDASNGAKFAVVPHVFPHANGTLSGLVGASRNLCGIISPAIFRYHDKEYHTAI